MPKAEVAVREETDEQAAYRLARAWKKHREDHNQPIVARGRRNQDVVFPLKNLIRGAIVAKYTEEEINEALLRCNSGVPTGQKFDDKLAEIRAENTPVDINEQGRSGSYLARRTGAPVPRSPADQRVADAVPLYDKYKRQEQEHARG